MRLFADFVRRFRAVLQVLIRLQEVFIVLSCLTNSVFTDHLQFISILFILARHLFIFIFRPSPVLANRQSSRQEHTQKPSPTTS
ncbi:hypothetical protein FPQ18DRAFT_339883 [Pyronema domesticum]|nr:hypothetical protein FPQ18DRAFT_339883 [Pyronema domesticum]